MAHANLVRHALRVTPRLLLVGGSSGRHDGPAVLAGVVFSGFARMVCRMQPMPVSDMRVVRGFFVVTLFVVSSSLAVVGRREAEEGKVALRRLGSQAQEVVTLEEAVAMLVKEARPPDLR